MPSPRTTRPTHRHAIRIPLSLSELPRLHPLLPARLLLTLPTCLQEDEEEEAEAAPEQAPAPSGETQKQVEEQERQLSKKELKKKELEDMDAVFAELGINVEASQQGPPPRLVTRRLAAASIGTSSTAL